MPLMVMGVREICNFRLVLEVNTGKEVPVSSRQSYLEKFSANNFALSDAEHNTSGPVGITDLPLLRTLLPTHQKCRQPSFWEVINELF